MTVKSLYPWKVRYGRQGKHDIAVQVTGCFKVVLGVRYSDGSHNKIYNNEIHLT